jgi:hypothetical protein
MSMRSLVRPLLMSGAVLLVIGAWCLASTSAVSAQCDTPPKSSCISCHAPEGHIAVMGDWNDVHVKQDLCLNCHGGNGSSTDKVLAHTGMLAQPLDDVYTSCHSCHPKDYTNRSEQFAATLEVTPGSCETPTPVPADGLPGSSPQNGTGLSTNAVKAAPNWGNLGAIGGAALFLVFFFLGLNWLGKHPSAG